MAAFYNKPLDIFLDEEDEETRRFEGSPSLR